MIPYSIETSAVPFYRSTITLTHDQIKTLPTAQVDLVVPPGVGKVLVPICVSYRVDVAGGVYANVEESSDHGFRIGHSFPGISGIGGMSRPIGNYALEDASAPNILLQTAIGLSDSDNTIQSYLVNHENAALAVMTDNGSLGNYTEGYAQNSVVVCVVFYILDV